MPPTEDHAIWIVCADTFEMPPVVSQSQNPFCWEHLLTEILATFNLRHSIKWPLCFEICLSHSSGGYLLHSSGDYLLCQLLKFIHFK